MEFTKDLQAWSSLEEEKSHSDHLEPWDGENHSDAISPNIDQDHVQETASEDSQDSADSGSDFGEKVIHLLHTWHAEDPSKGTRRSEQKKMPSSRWTEEAGFLPHTPKSVKKKGAAVSPAEEGTSSTPFFTF